MRSPGVRISSGSLKGRTLEVPTRVRPTEQKVREALFSIWGERLLAASLLDLFAGSGAVAIEAIIADVVRRGFLSATVFMLGFLRAETGPGSEWPAATRAGRRE